MEDKIITLNDEEIKLTIIYDHKDYDKFKPQTTALITIIDFSTYTEDDSELIDYILLLNSSRNGFVIYSPGEEDIEYVAEKLKMKKLYTLDQHGLDVFNRQFNFKLQIQNFFDEWDITDPVQYYNLTVPQPQILPDMTDDEQFIAWLPDIVSEAYCAAKYFSEKRLVVPTTPPAQFERTRRQAPDQPARQASGEHDQDQRENSHRARKSRKQRSGQQEDDQHGGRAHDDRPRRQGDGRVQTDAGRGQSDEQPPHDGGQRQNDKESKSGKFDKHDKDDKNSKSDESDKRDKRDKKDSDAKDRYKTHGGAESAGKPQPNQGQKQQQNQHQNQSQSQIQPPRQAPAVQNCNVIEISEEKPSHLEKSAREAAQRFGKRFAVFVEGKATQKANARGYDNVHPVLLGEQAFTMVLSDTNFDEGRLKADFGKYFIVSSE